MHNYPDIILTVFAQTTNTINTTECPVVILWNLEEVFCMCSSGEMPKTWSGSADDACVDWEVVAFVVRATELEQVLLPLAVVS